MGKGKLPRSSRVGNTGCLRTCFPNLGIAHARQWHMCLWRCATLESNLRSMELPLRARNRLCLRGLCNTPPPSALQNKRGTLQSWPCNMIARNPRSLDSPRSTPPRSAQLSKQGSLRSNPCNRALQWSWSDQARNLTACLGSRTTKPKMDQQMGKGRLPCSSRVGNTGCLRTCFPNLGIAHARQLHMCRWRCATLASNLRSMELPLRARNRLCLRGLCNTLPLSDPQSKRGTLLSWLCNMIARNPRSLDSPHRTPPRSSLQNKRGTLQSNPSNKAQPHNLTACLGSRTTKPKMDQQMGKGRLPRSSRV